MPAFGAADTLPFDSYNLSDTELERMQAEEATALAECAAADGLELTFGGDYIRPDDDDYLAWGGRLGTMTLDHAAEYGYHPSPDSPWAPVGGFYLKDPANVQAAGASDPQAMEVLYGVTEEDGTPNGGCFAELNAELGGPLATTTFAYSDIVNLALKHPDVRQAQTAWSECMSEAGYDFDTVQAASESFTMAGLSENEIAVATADVECTKASKWAAIFYFVVADYEAQAIAKQPALYEDILNGQQQRLKLLDERTAS